MVASPGCSLSETQLRCSVLGGNLCVPDLGIKVPYRPGTCLIIRGGALDHLVQDFMGTRYFIICTNHESCRQHALRKMGDPRAKPLPVDNKPLAGSQGGFDDSHDGSKARAAPDDEDILGGDGLSEEDLDESDDSDDDDMDEQATSWPQCSSLEQQQQCCFLRGVATWWAGRAMKGVQAVGLAWMPPCRKILSEDSTSIPDLRTSDL